MIHFILFFIFFQIKGFSFTLNNNFEAHFKNNRVSVYVASDTICDNAQITAEELQELVSPAINNFWNKVPTSSLRLSSDGFSSPVGTDINTDRLCAPTDSNCISLANAPLIPPVKEIVIACNSNDENFGGASATNVLAVTVPNNFSGGDITGAVILINNFSDVFSRLSKADKISVIAHEIGHAIGLGHAESDHKEALMYYRTTNLRKSLAQDDVDGVSFLYPVEGDGCGLISSHLTTKNQLPPYLGMGIGFLMIFFIMELVKLLHSRQKTRPTF
jgi:hypothetical protein